MHAGLRRITQRAKRVLRALLVSPTSRAHGLSGVVSHDARRENPTEFPLSVALGTVRGPRRHLELLNAPFWRQLKRCESCLDAPSDITRCSLLSGRIREQIPKPGRAPTSQGCQSPRRWSWEPRPGLCWATRRTLVTGRFRGLFIF